jgi:hypothetical protein
MTQREQIDQFKCRIWAVIEEFESEFDIEPESIIGVLKNVSDEYSKELHDVDVFFLENWDDYEDEEWI